MIVTMWFFLLLANLNTPFPPEIVTVGPFSTQAQCDEYRTNEVALPPGGSTAPCWIFNGNPPAL